MTILLRKYLAAFLTGIFILGCAQNKMNTSGSSNLKPSKEEGRRAEVLFLGNTSKHHDSGKYAPWLAIKLFESGINTSYTVDLNDLNPENLAKYDALIIYANHDVISPAQEAALKGFVEGGKGLVPLHSASGCFLNSEWYIKTIGGQFASHKTGDFKNTITKPEHPVMKGIYGFHNLGRNLCSQKPQSRYDRTGRTHRGREPLSVYLGA